MSHNTTYSTNISTSVPVVDGTSVLFLLSVLQKVSRSFQLSYVSFVDPLGTCGAILTILALRRAALSMVTFTMFISALSVSDFTRLLLDIPWFIINEASYPPSFVCKGGLFISYTCSMFSDLVVTAVAIERAIAVSIPHKAKIISTARKAYITITAILIFSILYSIQSLWSWDSDGENTCIRVHKYIAIRKAFSIVALVILTFCFSTIFICAIIITYQLHKQRHLMQALQSESGHSSAKALQTAKKDTQISAMLLSISVLFLITSTPIVIVFTSNNFTNWASTSLQNTVVFGLFFEVSTFLRLLNHALNFPLYCLSAEFFRNEVKNVLLDCFRRRQDQ